MKTLVWLASIFFLSCNAPKNTQEEQQEEDKTYILINGEHIEMVADEFGNQYLKQITYEENYIYIPFPFELEEEESLRIYQAKINRDDDSTRP
jgi:hypothetical protein